MLVTVHAKRGKDGMKAAGILPSFTGIAVHDAWKPCDTFGNVAGHALCGAEEFRAIRSYLGTAARHGTGALDAPHKRLPGRPWIPETG